MRVHESEIKSEVLALDIVYNNTEGYTKNGISIPKKVTLSVEKIEG